MRFAVLNKNKLFPTNNINLIDVSWEQIFEKFQKKL